MYKISLIVRLQILSTQRSSSFPQSIFPSRRLEADILWRLLEILLIEHCYQIRRGKWGVGGISWKEKLLVGYKLDRVAPWVTDRVLTTKLPPPLSAPPWFNYWKYRVVMTTSYTNLLESLLRKEYILLVFSVLVVHIISISNIWVVTINNCVQGI